MSASQTEVSTRVSVSGTQAVEADVKKLRALTDQLSAAGQRSIAIQSRIAERQKGVANSAAIAAKNLDFMSGKVAGLARGFGALSPALGDGAMRLAGFSATVGDMAGVAADAGPRLQNLSQSLMTVNSQGTRVATGMSKLTGTLANIAGPAVAAAAAGAALGSAIAYIADQTNRLEGLAAAEGGLFNSMFMGDNAGTKAADPAAVLERLNAKLGEFGMRATNVGQAQRMLREANSGVAASIAKLTTDLQGQNDALNTNTSQLLKALDATRGGVDIYRMTGQQLRATNAVVDEMIAKYDAAGVAVPAALQAVNAAVDRMVAAQGKSVAKWQSSKQATDEFRKAQRELAEELQKVESISELTADGQKELLAEVVAMDEWASKLGTTLSDGLVASLDELGTSAAKAKAALNGVVGEWWQNPAIAASIASDYAKAVEERKRKDEEWLKEQEQKQKDAIKGAVDDYKKRWGVAVDEAVVYFDTQFGNAHVSLIERVKPLLAAWGKAFGKGGSMAPKGSSSSGGTMRSGSGGGGESGGGDDGEGRALQLERLRKRLKQMTDESSMIRKHFSRGGAYEDVMKKRAAAIQAVKDQIDAIEGKGRGGAGRSAASTFSRLTADNAKSTEQLREERNWRAEQRQHQRQTNSHLGNIASAARTQVDLSRAQVNGTADVKDLLMRSGATEEESARLLAGMAKQTRVPDAFAAVSSRVTPGKGAGGSSGSKSTGRTSGGIGGERSG